MAGKRVLIIDDSRSARAFLARMLERHGLEVDGVRSAEEGFAYLRRQLPDALFLDHLMPGMDGFQALALIKKDPRTAAVPVMMYTSQQGESYLAQARQLGARGVLPKQLGAADVIGALQLLGLERPDAELAQVTTVIEPQRAPPQSMAADPGRPARDPALQQQLQELARQLGQQIDQQGERLFAELRALRREFAHLVPGGVKDSPLTTTIVDSAAAPAARAGAAAGRSPAGRAQMPPEVAAAIAEARRSLAQREQPAAARGGPTGSWKLALALLVLAALAGTAWLWRARLAPGPSAVPPPIAQPAAGLAPATGTAPPPGAPPAGAATPGAGAAGVVAAPAGARELPPWPGSPTGPYDRPVGAAAAPATDPDAAADDTLSPDAASAEPATGPYVPPRP